ncbi:DNA/RNA non-specific endonuclease [Polaromonas hydrogenivorans]|uniref:Endonuclease n=1 Tax=Polaromonas hydrogenivorans TaxID=335476 RepID=A0AAU7M0A9_9BURK
MSRFLTLTLSLAACLAMPTWAATQCPEHFAGGVAPTVTNPRLKARTQEVCFEAFAVLHSGISRTPLYSAEHLTRANVEAAGALSRKDSFHPEPTLPAQDRAELKDYARSGYDRGHMSPNADFANRSAQAESFSLANMVPQVHANNAGIWAGIEGAARQLAIQEGELYVVSGPAFIGSDIKQVGRVLVPTHLWKVLYSPKQQRAGAYVVTNDETREYSTVSVSDLETMVGVKLLPGLPQAVRDGGMILPKPSAQRGKKPKGKKAQPEEEFTLQDFSRSIIDAIGRAGKH